MSPQSESDGRYRHARHQREPTRRDSARQAARQAAREAACTTTASLATELGSARAIADSASLLVTVDRVTLWVVPGGTTPRLFDSASTGERFPDRFVEIAIACESPAIGAMNSSPPLPALVLEHTNGARVWADETTGAALLSRGNAGPARWRWNIRCGARLNRMTLSAPGALGHRFRTPIRVAMVEAP